VPKLDFILQGLMARTHTTALERVLELPDLDEALISVAYLNEGGVKLVTDKLKMVASKVTAFVGIRNDSTSLQGLQHLLTLGVKLYVVDTGAARLVYHPKLYMASSSNKARLVIGSANFTAGGLNNNIEAGVAIDLDRTNADDEAFRKAISDEFINLPKNHPDHVIWITTTAQLESLVKEDRLLDETEVEPPKPYISSAKGSGDKLARIKLLVKPAKKIIGKKAPAAKSKPTPKATKAAGTTIYPTPGAGFEHMWDSTPLTERDLSIPKGTNTNATGSINLDKGLLDPSIDHRDYFRHEVFKYLLWKPTGRKTVEEAHANFQLVIKGVNYGDFDLRIGHTTDKSSTMYLQRNAMTRLSWGPIKQFIGDPQLIGRTMSLYRDSSDPTLFLIEID
jgi:HKD family nuclease